MPPKLGTGRGRPVCARQRTNVLGNCPIAGEDHYSVMMREGFCCSALCGGSWASAEYSESGIGSLGLASSGGDRKTLSLSGGASQGCWMGLGRRRKHHPRTPSSTPPQTTLSRGGSPSTLRPRPFLWLWRLKEEETPSHGDTYLARLGEALL